MAFNIEIIPPQHNSNPEITHPLGVDLAEQNTLPGEHHLGGLLVLHICFRAALWPLGVVANTRA